MLLFQPFGASSHVALAVAKITEEANIFPRVDDIFKVILRFLASSPSPSDLQTIKFRTGHSQAPDLRPFTIHFDKCPYILVILDTVFLAAPKPLDEIFFACLVFFFFASVFVFLEVFFAGAGTKTTPDTFDTT